MSAATTSDRYLPLNGNPFRIGSVMNIRMVECVVWPFVSSPLRRPTRSPWCARKSKYGATGGCEGSGLL